MCPSYDLTLQFLGASYATGIACAHQRYFPPKLLHACCILGMANASSLYEGGPGCLF